MRSRLLGLMLLPALFSNASAPAQEAGTLPGFSESRLVSLSRSADPGACVKFEATFSKPLRKAPQARLDMERSDLLDGVLSFVLDVTKTARNSFSFTVKGLDPAGCRQLRKNPYVISVDGGLGPDGRPVLPDQKTFRSR